MPRVRATCSLDLRSGKMERWRHTDKVEMRRWRQVSGVAIASCGASMYASHADMPILSSSDVGWRMSALRALSALSEMIHDVPLAPSVRGVFLRAYCGALGISVKDCEDLSKYDTLRSWRTRSTESTSIDDAPLVSPCGGIVLSAGRAGAYGAIGDAKARTLLAAGDHDSLSVGAVRVADGKAEVSSSTLQYVVIATRAHDVHSFVAPATFTRSAQPRLVEGGLLAPSAKRALARTERVVVRGEWAHGLFAIAALSGAGRRAHVKQTVAQTDVLQGSSLPAVHMAAAVVMLFEAPDPGLSIAVQAGDVVRCGQTLALMQNNAQVVKNTEETGQSGK